MVDFCNFRINNPRDRKKNPRDRIEIFLFFKNRLGLKIISDLWNFDSPFYHFLRLFQKIICFLIEFLFKPNDTKETYL
jgi:hypothetical protein